MKDEDRCNLRCPKCGMRDLRIREFYEEAHEWMVEGGRLVRTEGTFVGSPQITRVEASCDTCNHEWRTRAATIGAFFQ
jgi:hypothetical protein